MKYKVRMKEVFVHEFEVEAECPRAVLRKCNRISSHEIHETPITNIFYEIESVTEGSNPVSFERQPRELSLSGR